MIRCFLCGHKGEPYRDCDGECCAKCGHEEFEEIHSEARGTRADASDHSHRRSESPELEVT